MSIALWGIKVTRIAQIAQKGVCIDGTSFTKQPRFTNVCSSAHEPYVHRLKAASFHERMFIGSRTLCSSAHGPYVRWTMNILSFEWRVNFTRVKVGLCLIASDNMLA